MNLHDQEKALAAAQRHIDAAQDLLMEFPAGLRVELGRARTVIRDARGRVLVQIRDAEDPDPFGWTVVPRRRRAPGSPE